MANAVIVVDMQNGFMRPDGTLYCGITHGRSSRELPRGSSAKRSPGPRFFSPKTVILQTTASSRCFLRTASKAAKRRASLTN